MNRRQMLVAGALCGAGLGARVSLAADREVESDAWLVGYYSDSAEGRAEHDAAVQRREHVEASA